MSGASDIGSPPVIDVSGLTKTFRTRFRRRDVHAVRDLSLRAERGTVVAFIGPNGAGKTTTIHALLGLLRPDTGDVRLFGQPAGSLDARRRTGFQSEIFHTYGFRTARSILQFYGRLAGLPEQRIAVGVTRQLERLGLGGASERKVNGFSKGMMQRLGLAQALLHEPELLILDEPTTGLDPEGRKLVADLILEEKARGTTVFLSSHILSDVERICDDVAILNQGRVAFSDSMDNLRRSADAWEIEVVPNNGERSVVRCSETEKSGVLLGLLRDGASIGVVRRAQSLEDLYMRYAGGSSSG